jgi:hypothetical protein
LNSRSPIADLSRFAPLDFSSYTAVLSPKNVDAFFLVVLAYFVGGKLADQLATSRNSSAFWPLAGVAMAALLWKGKKVLPANFVGAFLINLPARNGLYFPLVIAVGNTLQALGFVARIRTLRKYDPGTADGCRLCVGL